MKILPICPGNVFGGVETHLPTLARVSRPWTIATRDTSLKATA